MLMKKKPEKISKPLYWTPRILSILFAAFLALFSLDVFGEGLSFWQLAGAFLMHNIPVFVLAIIIWISWKHELVGAIGFVLAGLLYIARLLMNPQLEWYMLSWSITIAGPAFVVGILFFINWRRKRK